MSSASVASAKVPAEKNLSWAEVDWLIETAVSEMRKRNYSPVRIIPIGGGGIIPAAIMAYRFYKKEGVPIELMEPVYARSYDHAHQQHELEISWPSDITLHNNRRTLFVDDIVDTGATWRAVQARMPNSVFFALVTKIVGQPHYAATVDRNDQWWNFPWEKVPKTPVP